MSAAEHRPEPVPPERLLLRGFAPLVVGLILAIAVVVLVPSVAPERVVVDPGTPVPAGEAGVGEPGDTAEIDDVGGQP